MKLKKKTISTSLPASLKAFRPEKGAVEVFKSSLKKYFERIDSAESEENLKTHLMDLFKASYSPAHFVEQQGTIDFVVRVSGTKSPAAVLVEAKRSANKTDMIRADDINRKALHEVVLYFMRERKKGNTDIQHIVICTEHEIYIFAASIFERVFQQNNSFRKDFEAWESGKKSDHTTEFFYREIAAPFVAGSDAELEATYVDLRGYHAELSAGTISPKMVKLYKLLSPHYLVRLDLANDSNSLNKAFYDELLHLIGLEERKEGAKRVIGRLEASKRNPASLIENTISQVRYEDDFNSPEMILEYGASNEEREFNIALEVCLTWINRLLFLKLLEAQIVKFHQQDGSYKFLLTGMIADFDELSDLFFKVLASAPSDRPPHIREKFEKIPYLNSSLFELNRLEKSFRISSLANGLNLPVYGGTVLKDAAGRRVTGQKGTLGYIFEFLDAYDFGATGDGDVQEESKTLINAAVLGLIFEKINGYREGAIFTPGYVTMYMARRVIEKTVLEAFQRLNPGWVLNDIDDLRNSIVDRSKASILALNAVIDDLKICDPAVGSGHFLVSCLNALIALKSHLGILADAEGNSLSAYSAVVDNDELIVVNAATDEVFNYQVHGGQVPQALQHVQRTLFHEKQKLIEHCLFGVDINANSVRICQLRLWIELLKSAYYRDAAATQLETLPNIDINIKCGNSLLSRFKLDQNLSDAFKKAGLTVGQYRELVNSYKSTKDKTVKRELQGKLSAAKTRFQEDALSRLTTKLNAEIDSLRAEEAQTDLFSLDADEQAQQAKKLAVIREKMEELEAKREELLRKKTFQSALEWRFEFPEVLDENGTFVGFDIIIANPPYMRVQEIEATQPDQKEFYEAAYRTARGSYDLANLFFELAVGLSKAEGNNNAFIFPHKLFNSQSGAPLREYLMNTRSMKEITHFGANQVFDSATTYTCIALFNAEHADGFRFKRFALGENFEDQLGQDALYSNVTYADIASASALYGNSQWIFFDDPSGFACFEKIYEESVPFEERLSAFVGLQTSRDSLYVSKKIAENALTYTILVNPGEKAEKVPVATQQFVVEKELFKPFLLGKDVHRFETLDTDRLVFFPYEKDGSSVRLVRDFDLKARFPLTYSFVAAYEDAFRKREDSKTNQLREYYAYIYEKNLGKFDQAKLVSMEICSKNPNVAMDSNALYHTTKVYSFVKTADAEESYEFFAGLMNSNLFWWFLKHTGDTLQGDARTMKTNYLNPFPLPAVVAPQDEQAIASLVETLVAEKAGSARLDEIQRLEDEINGAVYRLYGLTDDQIEVVEREAGSVA
tara:strand:+ start:410 stop:4315 length:3906 start_codon:yes stop_codon:yes gene_type:complete